MGGVWVRVEARLWAWSVAMLVSVAPVVTLDAVVAAQVPKIHVDPVVVVSVARDDTARLHCTHPHPQPSILLWYRGHTSRPFLSYDARNKSEGGSTSMSATNTNTTTTTTTTITSLPPVTVPTISTTTTTATATTTTTNTNDITSFISGERRKRESNKNHISSSRNISNEDYTSDSSWSTNGTGSEEGIYGSNLTLTLINSSNQSFVSGSVNNGSNMTNGTAVKNSYNSSNGSSLDSFADESISSKTDNSLNSSNIGSENYSDNERLRSISSGMTSSILSNNRRSRILSSSKDSQSRHTSTKIPTGNKNISNTSRVPPSRRNDSLASSDHRELASDGTTLVIRRVGEEDQSVYRCRVHSRLAPTWSHRILLQVLDEVEDLSILREGGGIAGRRLPPIPEGGNLTLTCWAHHGSARVDSLVWYMNGVEVDSSWAAAEGEEGVVINKLELVGVAGRYRDAQLSCTLTTITTAHQVYTDTDDIPPEATTSTNITQASTLLSMFFIPEATLKLSGGSESVGGGGGGGVVTEGNSLVFDCTINADPPVYNITWLHNGGVVTVGGRRWMRDNTSLVVSPVRRSDAGLYACLASNREGDGHSNAVSVAVTHAPYCGGPPQQHLVVAKNTSVTLTCRVEAVPLSLNFTWKISNPVPNQPQPPTGPLLPNMATSGMLPWNSYHITSPGVLDDLRYSEDTNTLPSWGHHRNPSGKIARRETSTKVPEAKAPEKWEGPWRDAWKQMEGGEGVDEEVDGRRNPSTPGISTLTLTPSASRLVGCFARNTAGHMQVPCYYTLTVVEPPKPLTECNVTVLAATRMEVKCEDPAHTRPHTSSSTTHTQEDPTIPHHSPSLSFVRSPKASSKANMEVWSGRTLVANVSAERPQFSVRGLPAATRLTLVLYTANPHARSAPLRLYATTRPRYPLHFTAAPPTRSTPVTHPPLEAPLHPLEDYGWGEVVGGMIGVCVALLLVVVGVVGVWGAWGRWRTEAREEEVEEMEEEIEVVGDNSVNSTTSSHHQYLPDQQQHFQQHSPATLLVSADTEESLWQAEWISSAM